MPGPKPGGRSGPRPRPMGGFNAGLGGMNEHLDEAALKAASQQKQLSQQQSSTQNASGKSGTNPLAQHTDALSQKSEGQGTFQPQKPRGVGTLTQELVKRPAQDIVKGLKSIFDIKALLGINTADTPEEQAKKQQLHQRFQKLTDEQQQVAQKNYQEEMQKKKLEMEEEEKKKQAEAEQNAQALAPPSAPKKGPVGPASGQSKKQKSQTQLQQSRQGLSKAGQKH
jgi:predicted RND superfamily exporter protein